MTKKAQTCYRCAEPATTKEHFPPRCFFPRGDGVNLQLRTVPSCKKHNNQKSGDDQYMLAHICMNASKGPSLAREIFLRSILPQLDRSPNFRKSIADGAEHYANGKGKYKVNVERLDNFFDHLCWALYFERYGHPFREATHAISHTYPTLVTQDSNELESRKFLSGFVGHMRGQHPEMISRYEADKVSDSIYSNEIMDPLGPDASITIIHKFYGVFEVVSMLSKKWGRS